MSGLNSNLYLFLYAISIIASYIVVRRGWIRMLPAASVGSMMSSLFVFVYSISRGNGLTQAIVVSLTMGIFFVVASTIMAAFFRSMEVQPVKASRSAATPELETVSHGNLSRA
jgi:hypothetical protein